MRILIVAALAALSTPAFANEAPAKAHATAPAPEKAEQSAALRERMGQRQLDLLIASIVEDQQPQREAKRAAAERSASR